jgi:hypothetical protein
MAAGATNTNGSGTCPHCGTTDNMNTRAIGIEAGNNGTGEPWPAAQQDAYLVLCRVLCSHYGIANEAVQFHATYAPSRKIDPAGPSRWAPSGTWPLDPFQADVAKPPAPIPPEEEDDMPYLLMTSSSYPEDNYALFTSGRVRKLAGNSGELRFYKDSKVPVRGLADANEVNYFRELVKG